MSNSDIQKWVAYVSDFSRKTKAREAYDEFISALQEKDNRKIENTLVVKALNILLRPETKAFKIKLEKDYDELYRSRKLPYERLSDETSGISFISDRNNLNNYYMTGYDCYGSKEAPLTKSPDGRNNINGVSYLYLAKDEYTACAETRPDDKSLLSVAQFKILQPLLLIDFSKDYVLPEFDELKSQYDISPARLLTSIMCQFSHPITNSDDYYASQYIADYIRKFRVDGIAYRSSCTNGINYTIFNSGNTYIQFVSSKIVNVMCRRYEIVDLNSKKLIKLNPDFFEITDEAINTSVKTVSDAIKKQ